MVPALYDAGGFRVFKESTNGDWQSYLRDGTLTLAAIDQSGFSHFNLIGNGIFGRFNVSGSWRYYIKDHLGSTRLVTNNGGNILATFDYYPFGLLMPGRWSEYTHTTEKFTGKELDGSLGLYYFGKRYLDPAIARWLVPDPLAQKHPDWSPYNYVLDNPFYYIDPDGQQICATCTNTGILSARLTKDNILAAAGDPAAQQRVKTRAALVAGGLSLFVPGPEDVALGLFAVTKVGKAALRFGDDAVGFVKGLFRSGDEISDIASGVSKSIHSGRQGKHIIGHNNFVKGKSILTEGAQGLLDNFHSGNIKGAVKINDVKTRVNFGKTIGTYIDPKTGKSVKTSVGIIHNGKKGAHIVPARPKIDEIKING